MFVEKMTVICWPAHEGSRPRDQKIQFFDFPDDQKQDTRSEFKSGQDYLFLMRFQNLFTHAPNSALEGRRVIDTLCGSIGN